MKEKKKNYFSKFISKALRKILFYIITFGIFLGVGLYVKDKYFTIKHEINIQVGTLESQIKSIGELATVEYDYRDAMKIQEGNFILTKSLAVINYDGIIKAGVDMDQMELETEINSEGNLTKVDIKLPDARVLSHEINDQKTVIDDEALLGRIKNATRNRILQNHKIDQQLKFAIDGNIALAWNRATSAITELIQSTYGKNVEINFEKIPTDPDKLYPEEKLLRLRDEYIELVDEDDSGIAGITNEMIDFFYDNYYQNEFVDVMSEYVNTYAPNVVLEQLKYLNNEFEDTNITFVPKWLFNVKDSVDNDNYLYYEIYFDNKPTDLIFTFVYSDETKEQQCFIVQVEENKELSNEYIQVFYSLMSYYCPSIQKLESNEKVEEIIKSVCDGKKYNYLEVDDYVLFGYEDQGNFIAIVTDDMWEEL